MNRDGAPLRPLLLGMGWPSGQPGGLNRYLGDLFAALAGAGAAPSAVVLGPAPGAPADVTVAADTSVALPRRLLAYARAARRPADVVDAHFALYALLPVLLRGRSTPLVVHFQGPWADESVSAGRSRGVSVVVKRSWERAVYRRADRIVTLTGAFRRILVERYGIRPWHIRVIPPSVDLDRFSPGDRDAARARLGLPGDAWVAVTARRLVPRMGIDVLLEAWSGTAAENDLLVVVGDGSERRRLQERASQPDLDRRVVFLGRVDDDELVACYRAADVCVVPSAALEGYGLVVLEALACGTPVVTSDAGGLPEAAAPLDPSLVVPAGDIGALRDRLAAARSGTRALPSAGACRAYAELHSRGRLADRHLELYREAIESRTPSRRRIVYIDHTAQLSGGELALLRLLPALTQIDAHVILAEDGPLVTRLVQRGLSVEVLPLDSRTRELRRERVVPGLALVLPALAAFVYSVRLARRLRRLRPDIIHTNSLKAAVYGGIAGLLAGIPVIWHVRDRIASDYLPPMAVRAIRALARVLPAAVVANSRTTLETLGLPSGLAAVTIPSPVDASAAAGGPRSGHQFRVAIVGRIAPWKGQDIFLNAFARAFPDGDAQALVVGAALFGDHAYELELHDLARRLGITAHVEFTGFVDDVPAVLASVDVLVHASVVPEPFGQVVVEGLAVGTPVVAAWAGGPAEILTHGVDALLYEPGDADALAALLVELAADESLRRRLSAAGIRRASDFAPDKVGREVEALYDRVLAARSR